MAPLKVFISATSSDLRSYRHVVAEWARARGYDSVNRFLQSQPN